MIKLTNTLTGKKEALQLNSEGVVTFYACGITPSNYAHIGHGRCYVLFDVLYRFLKSQNYSVTYCRNITDIDDKLLDSAAKRADGSTYQDVANEYLNCFFEDMEMLNCLFPDLQPRATEVIPEIITFIEGLIEKGHAYESEGDIYFSVQSFSEYGKLSKRTLQDMQAGSRVQINDKKKDPFDFVLWKAEPEGTFWKSPWGYGRPGWHIECSAMVDALLGKTISLHAGGQDLIFPHHENEIAQSEALYGCTFAKHWMHVAFVQVNQEKMSKSVGNFFTLREVFEKFDPMVVRFYVLKHHYKSPLDFSFPDLEAAEKAYRKLCKAFVDKQCPAKLSTQCSVEVPVLCKMIEFLEDDLNTVGALGIVFEYLDKMGDEVCVIKSFLKNVLGFSLEPLPEEIVCITPEIQKLLAEREQARDKKDWTRSDELRDALAVLGYKVQDKKL